MISRVLIILCALLMGSCIDRERLVASVWLNSGVSKSACEVLDRAGFNTDDFRIYRVLSDSNEEAVPYCSPYMSEYVTFHKSDLERIIDLTIPKDQALTLKGALIDAIQNAHAGSNIKVTVVAE